MLSCVFMLTEIHLCTLEQTRCISLWTLNLLSLPLRSFPLILALKSLSMPTGSQAPFCSALIPRMGSKAFQGSAWRRHLVEALLVPLSNILLSAHS